MQLIIQLGCHEAVQGFLKTNVIFLEQPRAIYPSSHP
jgi:hypothetical protein